MTAPALGDTMCIRNAVTDPRGQEAETPLRKAPDCGNIIPDKIKNAVLPMPASDETVKPTCQGPRKDISVSVSWGAYLSECCALAFHVRQAKPFSTPTLQLTPDFNTTGHNAAVQSVLQEHQATGKQQKFVVAQNSLFK